MKAYTKEDLQEILKLHKRWLENKGGERADLREADLRGANLREADLQGTNLREADLRGANLREADLQGANLEEADLQGANLEEADLQGANLEEANLRWANLQGTNLRGANLRWADLREADLRGANLWGANLWGAHGNMVHIKTIAVDIWDVLYTHKVMQIGCERHLISEWQEFSDERINDMDKQALEWWGRWKRIIFEIIEMSPAEPTKATEEDE